MRRLLLKRTGQNTLEYALLIIVVVTALMAIQIYGKRGIQGRLRNAADDIGEQFAAGEPTNWEWTNERDSITVEVTQADGSSITYMDGNEGSRPETTTRYGFQRVDPWQ